MVVTLLVDKEISTAPGGVNTRQKGRKTMTKIGNKNVKVLRKHENLYTGVRVELTRKTTIDGRIIYAVVITNMRTGRHYRLWTYDGIQKAFYHYKGALA